jgi:hypothetical protein
VWCYTQLVLGLVLGVELVLELKSGKGWWSILARRRKSHTRTGLPPLDHIRSLLEEEHIGVQVGTVWCYILLVSE